MVVPAYPDEFMGLTAPRMALVSGYRLGALGADPAPAAPAPAPAFDIGATLASAFTTFGQRVATAWSTYVANWQNPSFWNLVGQTFLLALKVTAYLFVMPFAFIASAAKVIRHVAGDLVAIVTAMPLVWPVLSWAWEKITGKTLQCPDFLADIPVMRDACAKAAQEQADAQAAQAGGGGSDLSKDDTFDLLIAALKTAKTEDEIDDIVSKAEKAGLSSGQMDDIRAAADEARKRLGITKALTYGGIGLGVLAVAGLVYVARK